MSAQNCTKAINEKLMKKQKDKKNNKRRVRGNSNSQNKKQMTLKHNYYKKNIKKKG